MKVCSDQVWQVKEIAGINFRFKLQSFYSFLGLWSQWIKDVTTHRYFRLFSLVLLVWQLIGFASVSFDIPKTPSRFIADVSDTTLAKNIAAWTEAHGGSSGFYPLIEGMDALGV